MLKFCILFSFLAAATFGQYYSHDTIIGYLRHRRYTTLLHYLDEAGLTDTLNGTGNYTFFAPSRYYGNYLSPDVVNDTARLTDILKYSIVPGVYTRQDFNFNEYKLHSLLGSDIRVNHYMNRGVTTINGQRLSSANIMVANGVIHLVNNILTPPAGTILDILAMNSSFSTLYSAVQAAGLDTFLQDQSPITVFAPTNKAFDYLGADKVKALLANKDLLADILKYHVIPGTLYQAGYDSLNGYIHTFEEKDTLKLGRYLNAYGEYEVENGHIDRTETSATNGVLHPIDEVLIPASLAAQVNAL